MLLLRENRTLNKSADATLEASLRLLATRPNVFSMAPFVHMLDVGVGPPRQSVALGLLAWLRSFEHVGAPAEG